MRPRSFTDRELLDTARACFLAHGPGISTAKIAAELGVSQAALFKRFSTKQELMVKALLPLTDLSWIARLEAGPSDEPVRDQLLERFSEIDEFFAEALPCFMVLRSSGINPEDLLRNMSEPPPIRAHRAMSNWFRSLHQSGRVHAPAPAGVALAVISAIQSRHMLRHMLGERAPDGGERYLDDLVDFVWGGMAPRNSEVA